MRRTTSCRFFACVRRLSSDPCERHSRRPARCSTASEGGSRMHSPLSPSASRQYVTDLFESTAAYWRTVYSDDRLLPTIYQDRHRTALAWVQDLDLRPNARILEVGCGAGLLTVALARNGYAVDSLDS